MIWSSSVRALGDLVVLLLSTLVMSRVDGGLVPQGDALQPGTPCSYDPSLNISECYLFNSDGSTDTTIDPTQDAITFLPEYTICSVRSGRKISDADSDAAVVCEAGQWRRLEVPEIPEIEETSETAEVSETAETAEPSETKETAEAPETAETAEAPETAEKAETSETADTAEAPEGGRSKRWTRSRKHKKAHRCSLSHCAIPHGKFSSWIHKNHQHCTYHCDPGYELIGCETITCRHHNKWNGPKPLCRAKYVRPTPIKPYTRTTPAKPIRPSSAQPSRPPTVQPTKPSTVQPTKPSTVQLTKPSTVQPTKPSTVQPTKPSTVQPTKPSTVQPTKPSTVQPTKPSTVQPTLPATVTPAPPVVVCAAGSYSTGSDTCTLCTYGYYQDQKNRSACIKCPEGKSTYTPGATSANDCIDNVDVTPV